MPYVKIIKLKYGIRIYVRNEKKSKHAKIPHCHAITGEEAAMSISLISSKNLRIGEILESSGFSKREENYIVKKIIAYVDDLIEKWEEFNS
jgi:hypothetical protein